MLRTTVSKSRRYADLLGSVTHSEHFSIEHAVLPSQIEQLPDLTGYLKHASDPEWRVVRLSAASAWREYRSEVRTSQLPDRHARDFHEYREHE
jgi:hypothetical protein